MSKVLVIGDIMLDKYTYGEVKRLNPESPVPLINVIKEEYKLGGASNVAANIGSLFGECDLFGVFGNDDYGKILISLLKKFNINFLGFEYNKFQTILKHRFIDTTYNQQLLRVDYEKKVLFDRNIVKNFLKKIDYDTYDIIIISDYNKGVLTKYLFDVLLKETVNRRIKLLVDAKPINYKFIKNVYVLKPNFTEFCQIIGQEIPNEDDAIEQYGKKLLKDKNSNIIVTRGSKGSTLFELNGVVTHIKTNIKQVFDVTGAGDAFLSVVTWAIGSGYELKKAVELGNKAGSIVVNKIGSVVINKDELLSNI